MAYPLILLLGGSFDPIHNGHLFLVGHLIPLLAPERTLLIPCKESAYADKTLQTEATHRLAMIKLAIAALPEVQIETEELTRTSPSYAVLTLEALRNRFPTHSLLWVIGLDAYAKLPTWYQWQTLLDLCHLVVVNRAGTPAVEQHRELPTWTEDITLLSQQKQGVIYRAHITPPDISSTALRKQCANGAIQADQLPKSVADYIRNHHLYGFLSQ